MIRKILAAAVTACVITPPILAQEVPKREVWIPIYVTPYYSAADTPDGAPTVAVNNGLNELLSSTKPSDILAGRDLVESNPATVTPFSMMVLAIRLYDTGHRDDAVFWFYVAKYRAITLLDAITFTRGPMSDGVYDAIDGFVALAGPYLNGYAFCDTEKQARTNTAAIDWVEAHTYQTIFAPGLRARAKSTDLDASVRQSIASLREAAANEAQKMADPTFLATMREQRKANGMDIKFCW